MWPELPYHEWKDTLDTLHRWMEIVGKVKLKLAPFINQWWEVAFYISANGMTTGPIPFENGIFQIDFDFLSHDLSIRTSTGKVKTISLEPQTVAAFYGECMGALEQLGIHVSIWPVPVEIFDEPIPFDNDTRHASYDKEYVRRWWQILVGANSAFEHFRTPFRGKSSPIHFFWGGFDLAGSRFSGKPATPPKVEGVLGKIMKFGENEENFTFGFWPGDQRFPEPAFFSYMYPEPAGIRTVKLDGGGYFDEKMGEFILPYELVRKSEKPEKTISDFLESTYETSATLAGWDMRSLENKVPH